MVPHGNGYRCVHASMWSSARRSSPSRSWSGRFAGSRARARARRPDELRSRRPSSTPGRGRASRASGDAHASRRRRRRRSPRRADVIIRQGRGATSSRRRRWCSGSRSRISSCSTCARRPSATGHIPRAHLIPLDELEDRLRELPPKDAQLSSTAPRAAGARRPARSSPTTAGRGSSTWRAACTPGPARARNGTRRSPPPPPPPGRRARSTIAAVDQRGAGRGRDPRVSSTPRSRSTSTTSASSTTSTSPRRRSR